MHFERKFFALLQRNDSQASVFSDQSARFDLPRYFVGLAVRAKFSIFQWIATHRRKRHR